MVGMAAVVMHLEGILSPITAPTLTQADFQQSLTPSYALQLCSFPWLTAATTIKKIMEKLQNIRF